MGRARRPKNATSSRSGTRRSRSLPDASTRPPSAVSLGASGGSVGAREIGAFVRERRKANGLTQRELGLLAGVGKRFVVELEGGKPTLRLDRIERVLAVFGKRVGVTNLERNDA